MSLLCVLAMTASAGSTRKDASPRAVLCWLISSCTLSSSAVVEIVQEFFTADMGAAVGGERGGTTLVVCKGDGSRFVGLTGAEEGTGAWGTMGVSGGGCPSITGGDLITGVVPLKTRRRAGTAQAPGRTIRGRF
ncbi:MAG: hypothetical protein WC294_09145 [Methanoregula sp.]